MNASNAAATTTAAKPMLERLTYDGEISVNVTVGENTAPICVSTRDIAWTIAEDVCSATKKVDGRWLLGRSAAIVHLPTLASMADRAEAAGGPLHLTGELARLVCHTDGHATDADYLKALGNTALQEYVLRHGYQGSGASKGELDERGSALVIVLGVLFYVAKTQIRERAIERIYATRLHPLGDLSALGLKR